MGAIIELPLSITKKLDNTENFPYQWFGEVWKMMTSNKLELSDNIIQEIFMAQGKGKEAQREFYLKYGERKPESNPSSEYEEGREVWDNEFSIKWKNLKQVKAPMYFFRFMLLGIAMSMLFPLIYNIVHLSSVLR